MKVFLGIDLGTSAVKTVLLNTEGKMVSSGRAELSLSIPHPGYAEQNPLDWWEATVQATRAALANCYETMEVSGIGLSGQMLGSVLLDDNDQLLGNCIIWMDQRSASERTEIEHFIGITNILDRTANYPLVSYWAPKLLWIRKHQPAVYQKINKVLFPKDYIKFRLTGIYDIDVTDAAGTLLFDTAKRCWDWELFDQLHIPRHIVPRQTSESTKVIGKLTKVVAAQLGLKPGIPVVAGAGDQMCNAVGLGAVKAGVIASSIGTSGCIFSHSDQCIVDRKPRAILSYCHSVPDSWCIYGCMLAAGGAYKWLRNMLHQVYTNDRSVQESLTYSYMDSCAAAAQPGCEGLLFLPYLNGERTPYPDPNARGVFFGLSSKHGLNEICRSVLEGVTFGLRDTIEIMKEYQLPLHEIRVSGGGTISPIWLQMQADIFNANIVTTNVSEASAVGAAMIAAVGTGHYRTIEEAAESIVRKKTIVKPIASNVALYEDYYQTYRALYPALQHLYTEQAGKVTRWRQA